MIARSNLIFLVVLLGSNIQQDKQGESHSKTIQHGKTCPKNCNPCELVIEKAIKYLIKAKENRVSYLVSLTGLAMIANGSTTKEGPYQKELQETLNCVLELIKSRKTDQLAYAYDALFLAHTYHIVKSDEVRSVLETVRDNIIKQQTGYGGWPYQGDTSLATFPTTTSIISLLLIRQVGIEVEDRVFEKARDCYLKHLVCKDGSVPYSQFFHNFNKKGANCNVDIAEDVQDDQGVGRALEALWAMYLLGLSKTDEYKRVKGYVEKHFENLDTSLDGPAYHLFWGGLATLYTEDKTYWKRFEENFRKLIVDAQKVDGSLFITREELAKKKKFDIKQLRNFWDDVKPQKKPYEHKQDDGKEKYGTRSGPIYTTPQLAVTLQLHKGYLLFDKLKPMRLKETQESEQKK